MTGKIYLACMLVGAVAGLIRRSLSGEASAVGWTGHAIAGAAIGFLAGIAVAGLVVPYAPE